MNDRTGTPNFFDLGDTCPPLIAILRGLAPEHAAEVGTTLYRAGFRALEVPLNRPGALQALERLAAALPAGTVLGAGTVLRPEEVEAVAAHGGTLVVSPDVNPEVIRASRNRGLWSLPGAATPSEAFAAIRAGAHAIKAFPAEALPPVVIKSWRSVLPAGFGIYPVGGITPQLVAGYRAAGAADGFGLGGALFTPGLALEELARRATQYIDAWNGAATNVAPAGRSKQD
jgi:2-dehydro-3-deoxyphosphogalactonate aldolase